MDAILAVWGLSIWFPKKVNRSGRQGGRGADARLRARLRGDAGLRDGDGLPEIGALGAAARPFLKIFILSIDFLRRFLLF